jgi:hypothetical protein
MVEKLFTDNNIEFDKPKNWFGLLFYFSWEVVRNFVTLSKSFHYIA